MLIEWLTILGLYVLRIGFTYERACPIVRLIIVRMLCEGAGFFGAYREIILLLPLHLIAATCALVWRVVFYYRSRRLLFCLKAITIVALH